jgi:hypothetical protein
MILFYFLNCLYSKGLEAYIKWGRGVGEEMPNATGRENRENVSM